LVIGPFEEVVAQLVVLTIVDNAVVELETGSDAEVVVKISVESLNGTVIELDVGTLFR